MFEVAVRLVHAPGTSFSSVPAGSGAIGRYAWQPHPFCKAIRPFARHCHLLPRNRSRSQPVGSPALMVCTVAGHPPATQCHALPRNRRQAPPFPSTARRWQRHERTRPEVVPPVLTSAPNAGAFGYGGGGPRGASPFRLVTFAVCWVIPGKDRARDFQE